MLRRLLVRASGPGSRVVMDDQEGLDSERVDESSGQKPLGRVLQGMCECEFALRERSTQQYVVVDNGT